MVPVRRRINSPTTIDLVAPEVVAVIVGVAAKPGCTIRYQEYFLDDLAFHAEELLDAPYEAVAGVGHVHCHACEGECEVYIVGECGSVVSDERRGGYSIARVLRVGAFVLADGEAGGEGPTCRPGANAIRGLREM